MSDKDIGMRTFMTAPERIIEDRKTKRVPPEQDWENIANMWKAMGVNVPARSVGLMMIGLKLAREIGQHDPDNLLDIQGYAQILLDWNRD